MDGQNVRLSTIETSLRSIPNGSTDLSPPYEHEPSDNKLQSGEANVAGYESTIMKLRRQFEFADDRSETDHGRSLTDHLTVKGANLAKPDADDTYSASIYSAQVPAPAVVVSRPEIDFIPPLPRLPSLPLDPTYLVPLESTSLEEDQESSQNHDPSDQSKPYQSLEITDIESKQDKSSRNDRQNSLSGNTLGGRKWSDAIDDPDAPGGRPLMRTSSLPTGNGQEFFNKRLSFASTIRLPTSLRSTAAIRAKIWPIRRPSELVDEDVDEAESTEHKDSPAARFLAASNHACASWLKSWNNLVARLFSRSTYYRSRPYIKA
jgi:hypothetical protein